MGGVGLAGVGPAPPLGGRRALPAGQWPAAGGAQPGCVGQAGGGLVAECVHAGAPQVLALGLACWMACHTRWGVAGISKSRTPSGRSASSTALITAGGEPMAPA